MEDDFFTTNDVVNKYPELAEFEEAFAAQGSREGAIAVNLGLRFGIEKKDLGGYTVELGMKSAWVVVETKGCELSNKYTNTDPTEATHNISQSVMARNAVSAKASATLGTKGAEAKLGRDNSSHNEANQTFQYNTPEVIIDALSSNRWSIANKRAWLLKGLIIGGDNNFFDLTHNGEFQLKIKLHTYPSDLDCVEPDGGSNSREKEALIKAIYGKSLAKDPKTGAVTISEVTLGNAS